MQQELPVFAQNPSRNHQKQVFDDSAQTNYNNEEPIHMTFKMEFDPNDAASNEEIITALCSKVEILLKN